MKRAPLPFDYVRPRKRKRDKDNRAYLTWCHKHLFCPISLSREFDLHHLRRDEQGPIGKSNHDDRRIFPLRHDLHRAEFAGSLHSMGERHFFEKQGFPDYISLSAMLFAAFECGKPEMAQAALMEAMKRAA